MFDSKKHNTWSAMALPMERCNLQHKTLEMDNPRLIAEYQYITENPGSLHLFSLPSQCVGFLSLGTLPDGFQMAPNTTVTHDSITHGKKDAEKKTRAPRDFPSCPPGQKRLTRLTPAPLPAIRNAPSVIILHQSQVPPGSWRRGLCSQNVLGSVSI